MMRTRITSTIVLGLLTFGLLVVSGTPATAVGQCEMQGDLIVSNGVNVGQATTAGTGQVFLKSASDTPRVTLHYSGTPYEGKWVVGACSLDGAFRIANDLNDADSHLRFLIRPTNRTDGGVNSNVVLIKNVCPNPADADYNMKGLSITCGAANQSSTTNSYIQCYSANGVFVGGLKNVNGTFQVVTSCDAGLKTSITRSPMKGLEIVTGIPVSRFRFGRTGTLQDGFVAQDVEKFYPQAVGETTDQFPDPDDPEKITTQTMKTLYPLALIAPLYRSVQELDERMALVEVKPDAASSAAFANMAITECLEQKALKPEAAQSLAEAVLEQLGINPWVEIQAVEAFEEVDETTTITVVETVTKYRPNFETRSAECYTAEETVVKQQPTGRKIVQLKAGVRCDEKTGKFYRWCGLSGAAANGTAANGTANVATAAQTAAVLGKLLPGGTAVNGTVNAATPAQTAAALSKLTAILSVLSPQVSRLKTQDSGLQSQASIRGR